MPSLTEMCNDSKYPVLQRKHFTRELDKLLLMKGDSIEKAQQYMKHIWWEYDMGGHSCGRSIRSLILEYVTASLKSGRDMQKIKLLFSILVAMYFDHEYINQERWYDYHLEGVWDVPVMDRVYLCAVAFLLEIKNIPLMRDWPKKKILALLQD